MKEHGSAPRTPWSRPESVSRFRRLTAPLRVLPDAIILGEMRSGTTSLFRYLAGHPQVLRPWAKELHYFDRLFARGERWYRANFPTAAATRWHALRHGGAVTFEATPDYLIYPAVARRIAEAIPQARLIVLLRNPVDRAISHHKLNVRSKLERHSFEKAIQREAERLKGEHELVLGDEPYPSRRVRRYSYATRGIYVDTLRAYDAFRLRGQLLVIKSEDLFEKTQETYDEVLQFLGLSPWRLEAHAPGGNRASERPACYDELRAFFAPHNQRLYEYLGRDLGW
jgi:hypothetical protein